MMTPNLVIWCKEKRIRRMDWRQTPRNCSISAKSWALASRTKTFSTQKRSNHKTMTIYSSCRMKRKKNKTLNHKKTSMSSCEKKWKRPPTNKAMTGMVNATFNQVLLSNRWNNQGIKVLNSGVIWKNPLKDQRGKPISTRNMAWSKGSSIKKTIRNEVMIFLLA